ncbi:MAG TPA: divergent polysaccharide deacetylase family protein [Bacillota bacterium]|nr:divergent polysaccharide deacetylase family protein [Bacillota bacterium]
MTLFYLIFLLLLIIFQTKLGGESAVPAFTMSEKIGDRERSLYRLQDWQSEMENRLNVIFQKQSVEIAETTWVLKEKTVPQPLQWTTTDYRLQWNEKRPMNDLTAFLKILDESVTALGGELFFTNVIRMNGVNYYRLDYGVNWGNQHLVTHRLFIAKPERYSSNINKLGFAIKNRSPKILPKLELKKIGLTPKHRLLPPNPPKSKTKPALDVKETSADLQRGETPPTNVTTLKKARVAIIIDDFGFVKEPAEAYFRIRAPLTIAVLPGGEFSKEYALRAAQAGFEVLLHQPLEPLNMGRNNPGPGFISGTESEDRIRKEFAANLSQIPGAVGFNNHMGSAGTQDKRLMGILMSEAKKDGLFFIDSRSIANTIGEETAHKAGVLHAGRRVFLDNDLVGLRKQLEMLKSAALRDGEAIGIAHARPGVEQIIENFLPEFDRVGIRIVHVSELVHQ